AEPDLAMHEAFLDDRYLLCSDGLTDVVEDEAVHDVLTNVPDADKAVSQLIALAIRNGGPDNITCIVADVVDTAGGPVPATTRTVLAGAIANGDVSSLLRTATGRAGRVRPDDADGHGSPPESAGIGGGGGSGGSATAVGRPARNLNGHHGGLA